MKQGVQAIPELDGFFTINGTDGTNNGFGVAVMKTWSERERGQNEILAGSTASAVADLWRSTRRSSPCRRSPASMVIPIQFVINTTADYRTLNDVVDALHGEAACPRHARSSIQTSI